MSLLMLAVVLIIGVVVIKLFPEVRLYAGIVMGVATIAWLLTVTNVAPNLIHFR